MSAGDARFGAYPPRYKPTVDQARFQLVAVAFVRSVGGRVRLLLAIDRDGVPLFDGEPALLVEHRPGAAASDMSVEGAEGIDASALAVVRERASAALAELIGSAVDASGSFDGNRLLGRDIEVVGTHSLFGE